MTIDREQAVYDDATVLMRPKSPLTKSPLNEMYILLNPGTPGGPLTSDATHAVRSVRRFSPMIDLVTEMLVNHLNVGAFLLNTSLMGGSSTRTAREVRTPSLDLWSYPSRDIGDVGRAELHGLLDGMPLDHGSLTAR